MIGVEAQESPVPSDEAHECYSEICAGTSSRGALQVAGQTPEPSPSEAALKSQDVSSALRAAMVSRCRS